MSECPRTFLGPSFTEAINMAAMCGKGSWPVAGGILDQATKFIELKQTYDDDIAMIQRDQMERD